MKKILAFTLILVMMTSIFVVPVSAGQVDVSYEKCTVLDDASAEKLYIEAKRVLAMVTMGFLEFDSNDSIVIEGENPYYRVTDDNFSSYESAVSNLKIYFTDRYVNELLSNTAQKSIGGIINHEGKTYIDDPGMGTNIHIGNSTYLGCSVNGNIAYIRILTEILDDDLTVSGTVEHTFYLRYEDGCWKFDSLYLTNWGDPSDYPNFDPASAPQTSLTTITYAAVAALALGVVVVKKRG